MLQQKLCVVPASKSLKKKLQGLTSHNYFCICADVSHSKGKAYISVCMSMRLCHRPELIQQLVFEQGKNTEVLQIAFF